jgi:putative transposase
MNVGRRREMIEPSHPTLPTTRQFALVGIGRSAFCGGPLMESTESVADMRVIDGPFMETPRHGSRPHTALGGRSPAEVRMAPAGIEMAA